MSGGSISGSYTSGLGGITPWKKLPEMSGSGAETTSSEIGPQLMNSSNLDAGQNELTLSYFPLVHLNNTSPQNKMDGWQYAWNLGMSGLYRSASKTQSEGISGVQYTARGELVTPHFMLSDSVALFAQLGTTFEGSLDPENRFSNQNRVALDSAALGAKIVPWDVMIRAKFFADTTFGTFRPLLKDQYLNNQKLEVEIANYVQDFKNKKPVDYRLLYTAKQKPSGSWDNFSDSALGIKIDAPQLGLDAFTQYGFLRNELNMGLGYNILAYNGQLHRETAEALEKRTGKKPEPSLDKAMYDVINQVYIRIGLQGEHLATDAGLVETVAIVIPFKDGGILSFGASSKQKIKNEVVPQTDDFSFPFTNNKWSYDPASGNSQIFQTVDAKTPKDFTMLEGNYLTVEVQTSDLNITHPALGDQGSVTTHIGIITVTVESYNGIQTFTFPINGADNPHEAVIPDLPLTAGATARVSATASFYVNASDLTGKWPGGSNGTTTGTVNFHLRKH